MGMVCRGLTHCENCFKPLGDTKYGLCNSCKIEKEKQNKKKKENKKMSKTYKGYELIKAYIEDEEIKGNQIVRVTYYNGFNPEQQDKYVIDILKHLTPTEIFAREFELIEDNTIDIDSIQEFEFGEIEEQTNFDNRYKINQLIQTVKQLNKEIKYLKEENK